jgi:hypothetical protein
LDFRDSVPTVGPPRTESIAVGLSGTRLDFLDSACRDARMSTALTSGPQRMLSGARVMRPPRGSRIRVKERALGGFTRHRNM